MLTVYNGGSHKDEVLVLWSSITDFLSTSIKSSGNQIFIEIINDGYGPEKNFSASISFGIRAKL